MIFTNVKMEVLFKHERSHVSIFKMTQFFCENEMI